MTKKKIIIWAIAAVVGLLLFDEATSDIGIFTGPKGIAIYNCKEYLIKSNQGFEIVKAKAVKNDTELGMNTPPISVVVVVRMNGPYGPKKGIATFACDAKGGLIQPMSWPDYSQISQP